MEIAVVDRQAIEEALGLLDQSSDPRVQAAREKLRQVLDEAGCQLLTTAEAAEALGVRSVNTIKRWCKSGYIQGVQRGGRTLVPIAEIQRIRHADRVASMQAMERLHEASALLGREEGLSDNEMVSLSASRPGTTPWRR